MAITGMPEYGAQRNDGPSYVKDMTHHAHIDINGETTISWVDTLADGTVIGDVTTVTDNNSSDLIAEIPDTYGRSVNVASTDAVGTITVVGVDFLGQVMTETITVASSTGTGKKAFKRITRIAAGAGSAGDITLSLGAAYGLPFCTVAIVRETVDGATATNGAIVLPVVTTPSSTTGDVRGTYNPNTAGNGAKNVTLTYLTTAELLGGLYGQKQA